MKWYKLILLSLISGLLFAFSWYPHGLPFLVFFALIPMLAISDELLRREGKAGFWKGFIFSYPGFVLWNAVTTYWICYCTVPGGLAAIILNAMLQALVFATWHSCRKHISPTWTHPILLISFWIAFEYLHLNWDLTWPWLNLGNVFAICPQFVQWYSITGAFGGTLWILLCNFLIYYIILSFRKNKKKTLALTISTFLLLLVPMLISGIQYKTFANRIDQSTPIKAIVVQPNTDVWTEEFTMTNVQQMQRILDLLEPHLDMHPDLIVCPESSIPHSVDIASLQTRQAPMSTPTYGFIPMVDSVIRAYPNLNFILGLSTFDLYDHKATVTAEQVGPRHYIDMYNSAVCFNADGYNGHHHKSRLVPGVEALPFPKIFGFLGDVLVNLGGVHSSLGKDTGYRVSPIMAGEKTVYVCTAICYESIYGELCAQFVRNGAQLLTVITNDSWWNDSPGHRQHFEMARLRAVETRRYILRSANGGFSGIIDPMGNVLKRTQYNERTALEGTIFAQDHQTFYTKHGDLLAKIALALTAIGLVAALEEHIRKRILRK